MRLMRGYEGPDEDGYGMEEEYYYRMYDEFFRYAYVFWDTPEKSLRG